MSKFRALLLLFLLAGLWTLVPARSVSAGSIYASPYVSFSPDGRAWTTDRPLSEGTGNGFYSCWYNVQDSFRTGVPSTLRSPGTGEHSYAYERSGTVPVGQWRVAHPYSRCIQGRDDWADYHGVQYGRSRCGRPYFSGWVAHCADCGSSLDRLVYMSSAAARSITEIDTNLEYYYLCPASDCRHLEQAAGMPSHFCQSVSYNRYRVMYEGNGDDRYRVIGDMAPSFHMYNNAGIYEGNPVSAINTLSLNSFTREGHRFAGWNTKPDGTGTFYADGAQIWNLTTENYTSDSSGKGTVVLYAQWEQIQSTLVFDACGGSYSGENPVQRGYGAAYTVDQSGGGVTPPSGYTVSFDVAGGEYLPPVTGTRTFLRWDILPPVGGRLEGSTYLFLGGMGDEDRMAAAYSLDPVKLPTPVKGNAVFGGWFLDAALTEPAGFGQEDFTPAENCTLHAKWVELKLRSVENYTANNGRGAADLFWSQPDWEDKTYRLYQSADGGATYAQISSVTDSVEAEAGLDLNWDGAGSHSVTVPSSGFYLLKAEGAQGGDFGSCAGGKGGSVGGKFYLTRGEVITFQVGGQDGSNGGGRGTDFGNGGGMTSVVSSLKGTLLVAGGGGGATSQGEGQEGGIGNNTTDGSSGEDGMAGGGGGWPGGAAGEYIVHSHKPECIEAGVLSPPGSLYQGMAYSSFNNYAITPSWGENFAQMRGHNYTVGDAEGWFRIQLGGPGEYINVQGGKKLELDIYYSDWGEEDAEMEALEVTVLNSLGQTVGEYTTRSAQCTGSISHSEVVCREQENRIHDREVNVRTYSDARFQGESIYKRKNIHLHQNGTSHGITREFEFSGTLSLDLPEGTEGVCIVFKAIYQNSSIMDTGQWITARISNVRCACENIICGYEEGQVVSSRPGYGGASYVNDTYAVTQEGQAGVRNGSGSARIKGVGTGMTEGQELRGAAAADREAPYALGQESMKKTASGDSAVTVTFDPVQDRGTEYYFKAESYSMRTGQLLCTSNITKNLLVTGVKGYLYLVDTQSATEVTAANAVNVHAPLAEPEVTVPLGPYPQYLHMAAVDRAGNLSETVHVEIRQDDPLAWEISTDMVQVSSVVGGKDYKNIYPASDRTYYVRADGTAPFLLSFDSRLHGPARGDYQINYQIFQADTGSGQTQSHVTKLPYTLPLSSTEALDPSDFIRQANGSPVMEDAMYTGASRSDQAACLHFYQAFTLDAALDGKTIQVVPRAGASLGAEVGYSPEEEDRTHAVKLTGDGRPPVITGLDAFQGLELIDRNQGSIVLEVRARDEISGVRDFYLEIENQDNFGQLICRPDGDGTVRVEVTQEEPVFNGEFTVTGYAVDNVGNETQETWRVTEFALDTEITRILAPHEPLFKRGESGILHITTWGYADRVEVEFPHFLSQYNQSFSYEQDPDYKKEEKLQFMVPIDAPEGESYTITVRAFKGDKKLEEHPSISTMGVDGTILDEFRTRLR